MTREVVQALGLCLGRVHQPATRGDVGTLCAALATSRCAGVLLATRELRALDPRAALALLALVPEQGAPAAVTPLAADGPDARLAFYRRDLLSVARGHSSLTALLRSVDALLIPAADLELVGWRSLPSS